MEAVACMVVVAIVFASCSRDSTTTTTTTATATVTAAATTATATLLLKHCNDDDDEPGTSPTIAAASRAVSPGEHLAPDSEVGRGEEARWCGRVGPLPQS